MRTFYYIDNEHIDYVDEHGLHHMNRTLRNTFKIPSDVVDKIIHVHNFHAKTETIDDLKKELIFLFPPSTVLITYSMYTDSHYGSTYTFGYSLMIAGEMNIKNKLYINTSSEEYMLESLNFHYGRETDENKALLIEVIKNNYLISPREESDGLSKTIFNGEKFVGTPFSDKDFEKLWN